MAHDERIHAARSLRSYTDSDGAGRIEIRGPLDDTATILAALRPIEKGLFEVARNSGERGARRRSRSTRSSLSPNTAGARHRTSNTDRAPPPAMVNLRVDHTALVRGHTEPGEVCEIAGVGPVPVAVVSRLLDDAILRVIVVDGTDVRAVSHPGRLIPARLRTAVEELFPECGIEGCHVSEHLEIDHNQPIEHGGPTALWNLSRLCRHHHRHKHHHDLRLEGTATDLHFVPANEWRPPGRAP